MRLSDILVYHIKIQFKYLQCGKLWKMSNGVRTLALFAHCISFSINKCLDFYSLI